MRKIQKFSLNVSESAKPSTLASSAPQTPTHKTDQKKSAPKFNRKTSANLISHKPFQQNLQFQSSLCFISPKKSLLIQNNFFKSPTFQDSVERNSATLNGEIFKEMKENCESDVLQTKTNKKLKKISKKDFELISDLVLEEKQKESLLYQIVQLKKQNINFTKKLKDLEGVREFLMERQSHIYEISQTNMKQLQQINSMNKQISQLKTIIQGLEKSIESEHQKALKIKQSHLFQLLKQKQKIQSLEKQNLKLAQQIKFLKEENLKYNIFSLKSKQNSILTQLRAHRNPLKSKSAAFYSRIVDITNKELQSSDQTKSAQDDDKQNQAFRVLNSLQCISQLNESDSFLAYKEENSIIFYQTQSQCIQNMNTNNQNLQQNSIKKLKQKIKYYQIQIDILNKIKLDSKKLKDENEKFKALNRKYLNRIQYFTKRYSRRSGSDSSLQLSLTPKKINDLN